MARASVPPLDAGGPLDRNGAQPAAVKGSGREALMRARSGSGAGIALLTATLLGGSVALAQPVPSSAAGADRIKAILTEPARWTMFWSSGGAAPRPPASAASAAIEFTHHGAKIQAHLTIPAMSRECEFEVVVNDRGFSYPGGC